MNASKHDHLNEAFQTPSQSPPPSTAPRRAALVLLDTNILLLPGQCGIDIFTEIRRLLDQPHEICIVEPTLKELQTIQQTGKARDQRAAKLAADLIKHKALKTISCSTSRYADDALVELARPGVYVATQDAALQQRVKEKGGSVIGVRQRKYLFLKR
ncbi:hypothetical protein D6783_03525 [Candidatus Woesearchaeota archaeon]|nr:MAG: hypothetical protein D6783_03525 [Candidatus Woesearchaeota archaeon]